MDYASIADRMRAVLVDVVRERASQLAEYGDQPHAPATWLALVTEEVGEVAKEVADARAGGQPFRSDEYRAELVQVAALAVAAIEALDADRQRHEYALAVAHHEVVGPWPV